MKRGVAFRKYDALAVLLLALLGSPSFALVAVVNQPSGPPDAGGNTPDIAIAQDLLMSGQYDRSRSMFEKLLSHSGSGLDAHLGFARCLTQTGEYDRALDQLRKLGSVDSAKWHVALGRLLRRRGQYAEVLQHAKAAITIDGDSATAHWLQADMLEHLGRTEEAVEAYRWFDQQVVGLAELPRDAEWITATALGFLRYSVLTGTSVASRTKHVLNRMLQVAYERVDRSYWPARIAAADLLRRKFNNDEHDGSVSDYRAALRLNKHLPQAYTGLGEAALTGWQFERVEEFAEKALKINPRYAEAIRLLSKKFLLERRYVQAIETADRALAINPNDIEALSLRAAAAACRYDEKTVADAASRVRTINPKCDLFYRTVGDALAGIRQYQASEKAYQKAIEFNTTDANARTELGMMYMQWGDENKAREALEAAWNLDPFNERTKFTLELLEMLDDFSRIETAHFIVKFKPETDPGLGEFVANYLEEIYEAVTGDYETPTSTKTIIELFPTHRAFAVRITGKPWIHTVGAATGRVIALVAPRNTNEFGRYNLARVLKHEFTHTVTLEATNNRIPHWFTEGLAVMQEDAPKAFEWWRLLAAAARRDRLFTLESIDWGFIRPKQRGDRQLAYAQSEWMCEFIVERFGYNIIHTMLDRFKKGQTQAQVFSELFNESIEAFDGAFAVWARDHLLAQGFDLTPVESLESLIKQTQADQHDARLFGRLARSILDQGDLDRALKAAQRTLELDEQEINGLSVATIVLWRMVQEEHEASAKHAYDADALPIVERLLLLDPDHWIALKFRGEIALRRGDQELATLHYRRLQAVCPIDPASWGGLAGIYLQAGDDDRALSQLMELARLEEHDADIPRKIARMVARKGRLREAQYWYRQTLHVDPFSPGIHLALGDVSARLGDLEAALFAYRMLTLLEPGRAVHFERAAVTAHKLHKESDAQQYARQAVELNPESSARSLLP